LWFYKYLTTKYLTKIFCKVIVDIYTQRGSMFDYTVIDCAGLPVVTPSNESTDEYDDEEMGLTPPPQGDWERYENEF
jgi:hypothetical protein